MAEREVPEAEAQRARKAKELKRELMLKTESWLFTNLYDDYSIETIDETIEILGSLRNLRPKNESVPKNFKCCFSRQIMTDPVVLASGQTCDRVYIKGWFSKGRKQCPRSQQILSHTALIPNHLVRCIISEWCEKHSIEVSFPVYNNNEALPLKSLEQDELNLFCLKTPFSLTDWKEAMQSFRKIAKNTDSFQAISGQSTGLILDLLKPLEIYNITDHPYLHEDLIETVLNLSAQDSTLVAENPFVIPLLTESLKSKNSETRRYAAAALFTLYSEDSDKLRIIGESDALKSLVDLIDEGDPFAIKEVALLVLALCNLPGDEGDKFRVSVQERVVFVIFLKIKEGLFLDELLPVLAKLLRCPEAAKELNKFAAVRTLFEIVRKIESERNAEIAVEILLRFGIETDNWRDIGKEEKANGTLRMVAQMGTGRAKKKANKILDRVKEAGFI